MKLAFASSIMAILCLPTSAVITDYICGDNTLPAFYVKDMIRIIVERYNREHSTSFFDLPATMILRENYYVNDRPGGTTYHLAFNVEATIYSLKYDRSGDVRECSAINKISERRGDPQWPQ